MNYATRKGIYLLVECLNEHSRRFQSNEECYPAVVKHFDFRKCNNYMYRQFNQWILYKRGG